MKHAAAFSVTLAVIGLASAARAAPPTEPASSIVCRGKSAVGFSYAWGGECWCGANCTPDLVGCGAGQCTPTSATGCPDCTHTGAYGADCSGFVSKAWQVPDPYAVDACDVPRFVASSFTSSDQYWNVVPMNSLQPADAVASSTHVILVIGAVDAYGNNEVIEAKGCAYGIVQHSRTFASTYSGARRVNLTTCVCAAGDTGTQGCGDCGTQQRTCDNGCQWSDWSACEGTDPTGANAACTPEGATGACAAGQRLCVAGWLTCQAPSPSAEVCDGVDNDCDGTKDNGTQASLGTGTPCETACGDGATTCFQGAITCISSGGCAGSGQDAGEVSGVPDSGSAAIPASDYQASSCACSMRSGTMGASLAQGLAVLGLLGLRRRKRTSR